MPASVDGRLTARARGRLAVRGARILVCGLVCGLGAALAPSAAASDSRTVVVPAEVPRSFASFPFVGTGVSLAPGQELLISATGAAFCGNPAVCGSGTGPEGKTGATGAQLRDETIAERGSDPGPFPAPELTGFSLIARVGDGAIREIGTGPVKVSGSGELMLAYNDNLYHDNTGAYTATIVGPDTTSPVMTLPNDIGAPATGPDGAGVTFTATATDDLDGTVPVTCAPASGATFAIGATAVTCTAADTAGHVARGTFKITVSDTDPPALTLPADLSAPASGPAGADVPFEATATDVVDGTVPVTCAPASGATFAIGTTRVDCTAEDAAGNEARGGFTVAVADAVPPALKLPDDITTAASGAAGAAAAFEASAADAVDGTVPVTCTPASGTTFAIGSTTVSCTAEDAAGNEARGEFSVVVADVAPPALMLPDDITVSATGAAGAAAAFAASAADAVDGTVPVTCAPASGTTFAVGTTTVACTAADAAGNVATGGFAVAVVHPSCPAGTQPFLPTLGPWAAPPDVVSPCYRRVKTGPNNLVGRGGWLLVDVRFRAPAPV